MNLEEASRRALARSRVYSFLSPLFLYPDEEIFSDLNWEGAKEALALLGNPDGLKEAIESLGGCLKDPVDLEREYVRVFGHTISTECPPYETQYGSAHVFQQAQNLADIAGFYRAFGLEVSDQVKERLDHVAIELEFMAVLAYKQAYALASGSEDKAEVCREAQKKFLNDHLGPWVPLLTKRLEAKDGFYQRLALLTEMFLAFEVEAFGVKPLLVESLTPTPLEPDGSCFSCGVEDHSLPTEGSSWGESVEG
ncbi:MAG: molecular chaperone [Nitrospinota bacterium]